MVKSKEETTTEFNDKVNMTKEELEKWLEDPKSKQTGTGVGLESAKKIIEILKKNPTKDPEEYKEEDLEHMRKVVGYNKRHLAQEDRLKDTKTKEEVRFKCSLKNWGHDPIKTLHGEGSTSGSGKLEVEGAKGEKDQLDELSDLSSSDEEDEGRSDSEVKDNKNIVEEVEANRGTSTGSETESESGESNDAEKVTEGSHLNNGGKRARYEESSEEEDDLDESSDEGEVRVRKKSRTSGNVF